MNIKKVNGEFKISFQKILLMFYKAVHDLAWKRIVTCIRVTFEVMWNWKLSRYGAVLLSFLKRNDQKNPSATVQIVCSIQFKKCICILSSLFGCLFTPCCTSLTLVHTTDARHLIFPSALTGIYNVFLHFWACFLLLWWRYIISFCSKFWKLFYGSLLGNRKFYLI